MAFLPEICFCKKTGAIGPKRRAYDEATRMQVTFQTNNLKKRGFMLCQMLITQKVPLIRKLHRWLKQYFMGAVQNLLLGMYAIKL
jgi:hypothetical protein